MGKKKLDLEMSEIGQMADELKLATRLPGGPCGGPCAEQGAIEGFVGQYGDINNNAPDANLGTFVGGITGGINSCIDCHP